MHLCRLIVSGDSRMVTIQCSEIIERIERISALYHYPPVFITRSLCICCTAAFAHVLDNSHDDVCGTVGQSNVASKLCVITTRPPCVAAKARGYRLAWLQRRAKRQCTRELSVFLPILLLAACAANRPTMLISRFYTCVSDNLV